MISISTILYVLFVLLGGAAMLRIQCGPGEQQSSAARYWLYVVGAGAFLLFAEVPTFVRLLENATTPLTYWIPLMAIGIGSQLYQVYFRFRYTEARMPDWALLRHRIFSTSGVVIVLIMTGVNLLKTLSLI